MTRLNYGRWYMPTEHWQQTKEQGLLNQRFDKQRGKAKTALGSPKLQQYDWNIQAQNSVKKSIPEKESTLSKMLTKMSK